MTWMNEGEIERIVDLSRRSAPEVYPFAVYLKDWVDIVNANSDGWHSWKGGSSCASRLMTLLKGVEDVHGWGNGGGKVPTVPELSRTLGSIKACATRHGFSVPVLGSGDPGHSPGMRR